MGFLDTIAELGYELVPTEKPFIKIKKFDIRGVSDIVIIFDKNSETIGGGLIATSPIKTIEDIAHQYEIFRNFEKDIKYFSKQTGYDII